jgi:hypothetical protein
MFFKDAIPHKSHLEQHFLRRISLPVFSALGATLGAAAIVDQVKEHINILPLL